MVVWEIPCESRTLPGFKYQTPATAGVFFGLEKRLDRNLDARERTVAFMPEYAAYLLYRLHVRQDGKVAYERTHEREEANGAWG